MFAWFGLGEGCCTGRTPNLLVFVGARESPGTCKGETYKRAITGVSQNAGTLWVALREKQKSTGRVAFPHAQGKRKHDVAAGGEEEAWTCTPWGCQRMFGSGKPTRDIRGIPLNVDRAPGFIGDSDHFWRGTRVSHRG